MKTSELEGAALDWAVANCEGILERGSGSLGTTIARLTSFGVSLPYAGNGDEMFEPSTDWAQGGPIIEREVVSLGVENGGWRALCWGKDGPNPDLFSMRGPTPLIAAMRCYVASKLGDEVEVLEELLK